jgi:hypothetical protein
MLVLLAFAANAAPLGTIDDRPFEPDSGIAVTFPRHAGLLQIRLGEDLTCESPRSPFEGLTIDVDVATGAVVGASWFGGGLPQPMRLGQGHTSVPPAGQTGKVDFDLTGPAGSAKGSATYVVCADAAPGISVPLAFTSETMQLAGALVVRADVPTGWTLTADASGNRSAMGPDGDSYVLFWASCGVGDPTGCDTSAYEANAREWASRRKALHAHDPRARVVVVEDALRSPGTWVVRTRFDQGLATYELVEVLRWGDGWPGMVHCQARALALRAEIVDALLPACTGVTLAK